MDARWPNASSRATFRAVPLERTQNKQRPTTITTLRSTFNFQGFRRRRLKRWRRRRETNGLWFNLAAASYSSCSPKPQPQLLAFNEMADYQDDQAWPLAVALVARYLGWPAGRSLRNVSELTNVAGARTTGARSCLSCCRPLACSLESVTASAALISHSNFSSDYCHSHC